MKVKVEIMVTLLQAKECQRSPANHQKLNARDRFPVTGLRKNRSYLDLGVLASRPVRQ